VTRSTSRVWGLVNRLLDGENTQSLGFGIGVAEIAANSLPTHGQSAILLETYGHRRGLTDDAICEVIKVLNVFKLPA
jgi:hypothetical protein